MRGDGANESWGENREPLVKWETPLVSEGQQAPVRNVVGGQVQVISGWVEEFVQESNQIMNVLDEALGESYTVDEIADLPREQVRAFQYTLLGRAMLDVAESCFIHAAGLSDD